MNDVKKTNVTLFVFIGIISISAGIFFNELILKVLLKFQMGLNDKIVIRIFDIYLIGTGILIIIFRKSIRLNSIVLYMFSSFLFLFLFLSYDVYCAYATFRPILHRHDENRVYIQNVHVPDRYLGWKPKAQSIGKHVFSQNFTVNYEMDEWGFKKINNSDTPVFSIYFFGDSFTFGQGVTNGDTFPSIIKDKYLARDINVYNAGVLGYGIVQMFQRFLNIEDRIREGDLVIFTPLSGNIERNIKDFSFPYLLSFFYERFEYYPLYDKGVIRSYKMEHSFYNKLKVLMLTAPYTGKLWTSVRRRFIPDTTEEAAEMINIVRGKTQARGARFYLFFLPNIEECLKGTYAVDISGFDFFDIMHFFPHQKSDLDKISFIHDKHWNVHGHEIAAKAIVETLREEQIIARKYLKSPAGQ